MKNIKLIFIHEDKSIESMMVTTPSINHLFFSKQFCQGKITESVNVYKRDFNFKTKEKNNYPEGFGLIIINLPHQQIRVLAENNEKFYHLQPKDYCYQIENPSNISYEYRLNHLSRLVEDNALIFHTENNEQYHLDDIFNTTDSHKISQYLKKNYNRNMYEGYFRPTSFDLQIIEYQSRDLNLFLKDILKDGMNLNNEEVEGWAKYSSAYGRTLEEKNTRRETIKDIVTTFDFYHDLQEELKEKTEIITKPKL